MDTPSFEPLPYLGTTVQAFAGRPLTHDAIARSAARRFGSRPAVESATAAVSHAEVDRLVSAVATAVRGVVEEGDTVAVALGHDLPLYLVPFVASRAGITVLLLNTTLSTSSWAEQLGRAGVVAVIADHANLGRATEAGASAGVPVVPAARGWALDATADESVLEEADPDQTLALIATSGTTGVPKMSRVTTQGLIHAGLAYTHLLGLDGEDRSYVCLPLHYIGPLSAQTTTMPLVGGTNVIPADTGAQGAARRMAAADITYVDAVPAWLGLLARDEAVEVPTWRTLIYGGAPMPAETATALSRRFPDLALWDVWGLSETHGPATALRYDPQTPPLPGTVGRPVPGVEVRTDGDPGELLVRGANVTPGYFDDASTTAGVIVDGWLRTGDVGTVGRDGTVRLLDRAKDMIMRGGANVFSVEVEQVLGLHPDVVEAAVYGVADGLMDEAVAAAVVLRDGASLDVMALRTLVDERVGRHAVPRRIVTVAALPRNPTGKIDKAALRSADGEARRSGDRETGRSPDRDGRPPRPRHQTATASPANND